MEKKEFFNKLIEYVRMPINSNLQITKQTTPIPFFGNYETSVACTISLNPSDNEFYSKNTLLKNEKVRLCSRADLNKTDEEELSENEASIVLAYCFSYFKKNPSYVFCQERVRLFLSPVLLFTLLMLLLQVLRFFHLMK